MTDTGNYKHSDFNLKYIYQHKVWNVSHHWALHDSFEENEIQVIGCSGAGAVTQCVQSLMHCCRHTNTKTQAKKKKLTFILILKLDMKNKPSLHVRENERRKKREYCCGTFTDWLRWEGEWETREARWMLLHFLSQAILFLSVTLLISLSDSAVSFSHNSQLPPCVPRTCSYQRTQTPTQEPHSC